MRCLNTQISFFQALERPLLFTRSDAFKESDITNNSQTNIILNSKLQDNQNHGSIISKSVEYILKKDVDRALLTSDTTTQLSLEEPSFSETNPEDEIHMRPLKRKLWDLDQDPNSAKHFELQLKKMHKKISDDDKSISEKTFNDRIDSSSESPDSKKGRITMSQNYKSTIARGFVRIMKNSLKSQQGHYFQQMLHEISQIKEELGFKSISNERLALSTIEYVVDMIKEKSQRKKNNKTKARNVKIIDSIFFPKTGDENSVILYKEVSFKILKYFLKDSNFHRWVIEDCKSSEDNKKFLLENLTEIRKVFENPLTYKAGFHK